MAQRQTEKKPTVDEEDDPSSPDDQAEKQDALVLPEGAPLATTEEGDHLVEGGPDDGGDGGDDGEQAAAQLGTDRYVLAGFFAAGMLGAYVIGRALQAIWQSISSKDWFSKALPSLAAVPDDDKGTYAMVVAGLVAIVLVWRTYRKPEVRAWSDEVAGELAKCVWPTRKDVSNSTVVVIVASAAATLYMAGLDRLWSFITNLVYGDGS